MNIKRIIAGVLAVCVMGTVVSVPPRNPSSFMDEMLASASTVIQRIKNYDSSYISGTYEGLEYELQGYGEGSNTLEIYDDSCYAITGCDKNITSIIIPDKINDIPVEAISDEAFRNCTELKSVTLPETINDIGTWAFYNCTSLTVFNSSGNPYFGTGAFQKCSSLEEITISRNLSEYAFAECTSLKKVVLTDDVKNIAYNSFEGCYNVEYLEIGAGISDVSKLLSQLKNLKEIRVSKDNPFFTDIDGVLFNKDCTELIKYPPKKADKSYKINDGVNKIAAHAFKSAINLVSVDMPDSVSEIGGGVFAKCSSLESVKLSKNITKLGSCLSDDYMYTEAIDGFFADCNNLKTVVIPDNVTIIEDETFSGCSALDEIKIPNNVTSIGKRAFWNCVSLEEIKIPNKVTSIGTNAFGYEEDVYNSSLKSVTIPKMFVTLDLISNVFSGNTNFVLNYNRDKLIYNIKESEANRSNIAKSKSVEAEINYSTIDNHTSPSTFGSADKLQECKDSKGNIYAIYGGKNSITLFSENTDKKTVTIKNEDLTFGAAVIDENDNLYVLWGHYTPIKDFNSEWKEIIENLVIMKYDLNGKVLGRCIVSKIVSKALNLFDAGNASMAVNDDVVGCFFNTIWTNGHQGSEFAAIDKNTMELIEFSSWEGSHSFGVSLIPTDYGFAGIQKGDVNDTARGINFNSYLVSDNKVKSNYLAYNGYKLLFSASGQYGTNESQIDGNATYLHMGGLAKSATTYAVVGKSERIYSSMSGYGNSDLRTNNYDVFLKITDQTLAQTASDLVGEERVDVETGETADYNIIWLTECNETEKAGQCKVVTLADGSYCVLWEKFVNDKFDSIRYVVTDECGNILRHETGIYGARLSDTSVQPIVDEYTLKWAVADEENQCINFYTVDLNEFSETPIKDVFGDANCDGKVTIADSTAILQSLGNPDKYGLSEQGAINADCCNHGDGVMTSDALAIQMVDAGMLKQEQLPIAKLPDIKN